MAKLEEAFEQALLSLNRLEAKRIAEESSGALSPIEFVETVVARSLDSIGREWEKGDVALSQVYMSGRICEEIVEALLPPGNPQRKDQPAMAIAVLDDYHMLGKRIVYSALRAGGFDLHDYGRVTVDQAIQRTKDDNIKILLISVLMLNSALHVRNLVAEMREAGLHTKVVVGGAPFIFDTNLWKEVHADAMGHRASEAIEIVRAMERGMS